jgi:hypothetical protein
MIRMDTKTSLNMINLPSLRGANAKLVYDRGEADAARYYPRSREFYAGRAAYMLRRTISTPSVGMARV